MHSDHYFIMDSEVLQFNNNKKLEMEFPKLFLLFYAYFDINFFAFDLFVNFLGGFIHSFYFNSTWVPFPVDSSV